ncbi:protein of unknown function [Moritella yayanosii]|uniref:Uncharacterized protein n=1 Tax=Moritella yayanosii TaxID=69539 RepID=A0A330LV40_9GAMM|nr:protein of unknown function [Moritella yayanosii]
MKFAPFKSQSLNSIPKHFAPVKLDIDSWQFLKDESRRSL